jgi:hypothetical protein
MQVVPTSSTKAGWCPGRTPGQAGGWDHPDSGYGHAQGLCVGRATGGHAGVHFARLRGWLAEPPWLGASPMAGGFPAWNARQGGGKKRFWGGDHPKPRPVKSVCQVPKYLDGTPAGVVKSARWKFRVRWGFVQWQDNCLWNSR